MSDNSEPAAAGKVTEEAPGWLPAVFLFGVVCVVFRFGGVWSWWALLWAPLLAAALGVTVYEWRLLARSRWRMPVTEWCLLAAAHAGCAAALGVVLGLLRY
ncbi:hypothetical protein GCM10018785_49520 [Streptomyces longispororuber]|uniref:Uncharacterized protein n=1 Tax=Streptomyces longispororuber TaxID=68230 RepID=A0A918ZX81_9ACTN|nr:hypothetical protein [Streptomyces longispororuber]GHE75232.1 hypothetical protein GCM10018785_49520 [Streptomyces longispororuber]